MPAVALANPSGPKADLTKGQLFDAEADISRMKSNKWRALGTIRGDPDIKMTTLGLHGGARWAMGGNSVVRPFLNLDYVNARLDEYIETGLEGANLHVDGGGIKRTFLTGGVKYATQMGGVVPEVKLAYRHRFGDRRARIEQAFLCQTDTECEFDVVSASEKRGTFLAGLSVGGKVGPVDLRIGYEGEFNSDIRSHAGNFRVILPLGGRPAPAPVVAPPPRWSEVSAAKPTRSREGTTTGK